MCGLAGIFATSITSKERDMFKDLLGISGIRGTDSTGLIIGNRKKKHGPKIKFDMKKAVMNPYSFLDSWEVEHALKTEHVFLLAGHCRYTTSGKTNFHNAHPIQAGNILLEHNGTITKWDAAKGDEDKTSDSRIFAGKISTLGAIPALKEADSGAYAVTFVDTEKKTFNIARNSGRTLYMVFTNDDEAMMWASEAEMLELVLKRNGLRHNWGAVTLVPQMKHFIWNVLEAPGKGSYKDYGVLSTIVEDIDKSKYGTSMSPEQRVRYEAWLKDNSGIDWEEGDVEEFGPGWNAHLENANEQTAETPPSAHGLQADRQSAKEPLTLCGVCEKEEQYCVCEPDTHVGSGAFCAKCKERLKNCHCKFTQPVFPPVWELDARGNWRPDAAERKTSVPVVGTPTSNTPLLEDKTKPTMGEAWVYLEKEYTAKTYPKTSPIGKVENWFLEGGSDDDTYIGYLRNTMPPSVATERLKGGCHICGHESTPPDSVFWYSDFGHVCPKCHDGPDAREMLGLVSTYKSRYIVGEKKDVVVN